MAKKKHRNPQGRFETTEKVGFSKNHGLFQGITCKIYDGIFSKSSDFASRIHGSFVIFGEKDFFSDLEPSPCVLCKY